MESESKVGSPCPTVQTALAWALPRLLESGIEAPRLTAELLLAHVLGWERVRILSHPDDALSAGSLSRFQELVRRRSLGEPLQYLTGEREFYGLSFRVNPAVLVPRPETEILVEKALHLAQDCSRRGGLRFVDVGTGSGCIAITFARQVPHARGCLVDLSPEALAVARFNALRHLVASRLEFVCGDLLACFVPRPIFDIVLANPPYVSRAQIDALPSGVRDHEPRMALNGGESGLEVYERLIPQAACRVAAGGRVLLEMGAGQAGELERMLEAAGLHVQEVAEDLQGIPRCVIAAKQRQR
jgi:release factor glutamine methyltransferase